MISSYDPDLSAEASDVLYTALLSQRDLSQRVPFNYVTAPGVGLTPVCFSDNNYQDAAAQRCLSNLLSAGFTRFVIDIYWDESRQTWSLCPVELATFGNSSAPARASGGSTSLSTSSSSTSPVATLSVARISGGAVENRRKRAAAPSALEIVSDELRGTAEILYPRQTSELSLSESNNSSSQPSSNVQAASAVSATSASGSSPTTSQSAASATASGSSHQIGPYSCTTTIGISTLTDVLADFFEHSENSVNATFKFLEFNVHSAAPFEDPTGVATQPDQSRLPASGNYISQLLNTSLSSYIYTPYSLTVDRANLNESWFALDTIYQPLAEYITTEQIAGNTDLYTSDGWPSESVIELRRALRFIAGFGTVDPQMQQYDFDADVDTIFPVGYISSPIDVTVSANGDITNGCFYQSNITSLSAINSSWAVSSNVPNITSLNTTINSATNLSSCGISPILNETLNSQLAIDNASSYLDYMRQTIWSWADDQPAQPTETTGDYHCAIVDMSNGGKWQVTDCSDNHYGACKNDYSPYEWSVSRSRTHYGQIDKSCATNTSFAVPRTALENHYLRATLEEWLATQDPSSDTEVFWVNFNDLDVQGCWVTGVNQTCPYVAEDRNTTKTVVVPTVAAIIVFLLAISMVFVKCAANRRNTRRRRRRGDGGWDYEGVPS